MSDDGFIPDPAYQLDGFVSAAGYSTIGYRNRAREGRCKANKNTCKGFRTKNSDFCAGHKRAFEAAAKRAEESDE